MIPLHPYRGHRLTLFGRSLILVACELIANATLWIVAGILFGRSRDTQPILSLALLAWTIGLRHALDADHISAIDNATRGLISLGQLPVTCGLFFSLGHSTIVIAVNVAIAISTDVADKIGGVGDVGGIVGSAISATFLFIVGLANSIILHRILKKRRRVSSSYGIQLARGEEPNDDYEIVEDEGQYNNTIMMKILGPVVRFVDSPWKMYPVGVLFGFGFDTASSIALLAASALAKKGADGHGIPPADIVILPLLFTAGMTLLDSVDSIIMLYSYSGFPDRSFRVFERVLEDDAQAPLSVAAQAAAADIAALPAVGPLPVDEEQPALVDLEETPLPELSRQDSRKSAFAPDIRVGEVDVKVREVEESAKRELRVKKNMMSRLSILLTFMSILVAFSISFITIMGLIGDNCSRCRDAADAEDGGGLAGRWWRFWDDANDNSGYIGAAIVGSFVVVVGGWYGVRWATRSRARRGVPAIMS
ncbi:NicO-domain-containing protein [Artomyces pyxidatus]|uniref:NicO-domain-containing protein n=1 Tax=Artomyces pyxidatus TaxID=48021 RepID=A0ACB8SJH9_9AGAM|nr:NicO-domain-containing protein [Artomyces pyxidatus]